MPSIAELLSLSLQVTVTSIAFGGVSFVVMEFAVRPLTSAMLPADRARARARWSIAMPLISASAYLASTGAMSWVTAPLVAAMAFGGAWALHKKRNANERADA